MVAESPSASTSPPEGGASPPLAGQSALITGGGSGIGLACARALLVDGASVTLMGRTEARLAEAAATLGDLLDPADRPRRIAVVAGDVSTEGDVVEAVGRAVDHGGGLHLVVAAAGTGGLGPIGATSLDEWQGIMDVNLTGCFLTFKHGANALVASGGGAMVAISSIAGVSSHRYMGPYCVSKAGLDMLVSVTADELGQAGVRVNSVRPGLVETELVGAILADEGIVGDYRAQMPVDRLGQPDDVAAAVRFLCGPESSWVTGVHLSVDGGHHLRRGPNFEPAARLLFGDAAAEGRHAAG
ncbi:MAG: SDR family oxidoreductase [Acidimicrobiia bacterium]|nr:SDR family oxidoreductase [Acidimicrobiia bacterium]